MGKICVVLPVQIQILKAIAMSRLSKTKTSLFTRNYLEPQNTTQSTIQVGRKPIQLKRCQMIDTAVLHTLGKKIRCGHQGLCDIKNIAIVIATKEILKPTRIIFHNSSQNQMKQAKL